MRYVFGEWTLDTQRAELACAGRVCRLRRKAFQVLAYLLAHPDRLVFITGEPGIGKTTLVDAFLGRLADAAHVWIGRGQCVEEFGAGEAYRPVLEALGRLGRGPGGPALVALLAQQAPTWLVQMPGL